VSTAVKNVKVPITAKIRVFESVEKTVAYAKMIESTGIAVNRSFEKKFIK
jgi:tRNA-dihydrouridine synthase 1